MTEKMFGFENPLRGAVNFRRSREPVTNEVFNTDSLERDRKLLDVLSGQMANKQNFKLLFGALEKNIPAAISEVFPVMRNYIRLKESFPSELTEKDVEYINHAIKYLEDWFYREKWLDTSDIKAHGHQARDYNSLYLPAALFNLLAKIVHVAKPQGLYTPEPGRIYNLIEDSCKHAVQNLNRNLSSLQVLGTEINYLVKKHQKQQNLKTDPGNFSLEKIVDQIQFIKHKMGNESKIRKHNSEQSLADLLNREKKRLQTLVSRADLTNRLYFFKSCLLAARMQRLQDAAYGDHLFLPPLKNLEEPSEHARAFDFETGKISERKVDRPFSTMHFMSKEIVMTLSVVDYLRNRKLKGNKNSRSNKMANTKGSTQG